MNDPRKVFLPYWLQTAAPFAMRSGLLAPPSGNPWPQTSLWTQPMPQPSYPIPYPTMSGSQGAQYSGERHHFLPQAHWRKLPLAPETRKVFDKETSGHLHIRGHANDRAHRDYSDATEELMDRFMKEHNIKPEDMTPDQARSLLKTIAESQDPRIRNYRQYIQRLLLRYQLRVGGGRGNE
jgi:hypothetical protein